MFFKDQTVTFLSIYKELTTFFFTPTVSTMQGKPGKGALIGDLDEQYMKHVPVCIPMDTWYVVFSPRRITQYMF